MSTSLLLVVPALALATGCGEPVAAPTPEPAGVAQKRRAIEARYGGIPTPELLRAFVAAEGPDLPPLYIAVAIRKAEALPAVLRVLRDGSPLEQRKITKLLRYERWPEALPVLMEVAASDAQDPIARIGALYALRAIGPAPVAEELTALLERPGRNAIEKRVLIAALARSAYAGAIPRIRPYLEHENLLVRIFAARALAELGSPVDRRLLFDSLGHDDHLVRQAAAGALGSLEGHDVLDALAERAQNDPHSAVRSEAKVAVRRSESAGLSAAERTRFLREVARDPDLDLKSWAIDTLAAECGEPGRAVLRELAASETPEGARSGYQLLLLSGTPANPEMGG